MRKLIITLGLIGTCFGALADSALMSLSTASSLGSNDWFYVVTGGTADGKFNFGQLTNEMETLITWPLATTANNLAASATLTAAQVTNALPAILTNAISGNALTSTTVTQSVLTNQIPSTNVLVTALTLLSSGNVTNYTVDLYPGPSGNLETIYLANSNAFLTFTGTNQANWHRTVLFRAWTNTIVSRIAFVSPVRTNLNFVSYVTNGMAKVLNFYNPDTTGTNLMVSDAGFYQ